MLAQQIKALCILYNLYTIPNELGKRLYGLSHGDALRKCLLSKAGGLGNAFCQRCSAVYYKYRAVLFSGGIKAHRRNFKHLVQLYAGGGCYGNGDVFSLSFYQLAVGQKVSLHTQQHLYFLAVLCELIRLSYGVRECMHHAVVSYGDSPVAP